MSNSRYYIVGNNDVWVIQFKDAENGQYKSNNEAAAFAIAAAQNLGCGENAHTYACLMTAAACDASGATIEIVTCAGVP